MARLDDVLREVRRQGRAAVAAQAAAEACLECLHQREADASESAASNDAETEDESDALDGRGLEALLPVADALDRIAALSARMAAEQPARGFARLRSLFGARRPDPGIAVLAEGLRILRAQLAGALESQGVLVDHRIGIPFDAHAHRAVGTRPPRGEQREGYVVEIVRPGYAVGSRVVREAEVIVVQK
jgi:molecular chaperone GrpE